MSLYFHSLSEKVSLKEKSKKKLWIKAIIVAQKKQLGEINIIILSDEQLLKMNKSFLKQDYFTDIITFDYNEGILISGDLFLSIERIKENSKKYTTTLDNEFLRVIAHGIFHLLGFDDKSRKEKREMSLKEDEALKLYYNLFQK